MAEFAQIEKWVLPDGRPTLEAMRFLDELKREKAALEALIDDLDTRVTALEP